VGHAVKIFIGRTFGQHRYLGGEREELPQERRQKYR